MICDWCGKIKNAYLTTFTSYREDDYRFCNLNCRNRYAEEEIDYLLNCIKIEKLKKKLKK